MNEINNKFLKFNIVSVLAVLAITNMIGCGNGVYNSGLLQAPATSAPFFGPTGSNPVDPKYRPENFECPYQSNIQPVTRADTSQTNQEYYKVCSNPYIAGQTLLWVQSKNTMRLNNSRICVFGEYTTAAGSLVVPNPTNPRLPHYFCTNLKNGEAFIEFSSTILGPRWNSVLITSGEYELEMVRWLLSPQSPSQAPYSFGMLLY